MGLRRLKSAWPLLAFLVWGGLGNAAPVTFNTALPVAKGMFVFRELFVVRRARGHHRKAKGWTSVSVLGYGIDPRWAVFAVLPVVGGKSLSFRTSAGQRQRSAAGLGDLLLFGRYTVYQHDLPGQTLRLAPFAGVEFPTGDDHERDAAGRLPPPLQPGSGSWDAVAGVVASWQTLAWEVDAQLGYRLNTEAHDFKAGDRIALDASWQQRLWPRRLTSGLPGFLYGVLEVNGSYQWRNRISGHKDPDSGGWRLFLTPGLQYAARRWVVEGVVQLPLVQDLNGRALKDEWIVRAGFRIAF